MQLYFFLRTTRLGCVLIITLFRALIIYLTHMNFEIHNHVQPFLHFKIKSYQHGFIKPISKYLSFGNIS